MVSLNNLLGIDNWAIIKQTESGNYIYLGFNDNKSAKTSEPTWLVVRLLKNDSEYMRCITSWDNRETTSNWV